MAKKKCKGGKCSLIGRPKAQTPGPIAQARQAGIQGITQQLAAAPSKKNKIEIPQSRVYIPGFPKEVMHTPTAAAQYYANQLENALPPQQQVQPQQQPQTAALPQNVPQQFNPVAQGQLPGPLLGLAQSQGWYSPYAQQQAQQPTMQQPSNIPMPNPQNTAIPQGQVMHPTGKQRGRVGRFFSGTRPQVYNNPLYNQYQNDVLNYITQFGLEGLNYLDQNEPGNMFNFAPIGNQELERFYSQTIPTLAERFTALGDGQRSSAFQGALANAGRFLGNDLAAQQQMYNLQQQQLAQNQYGMNQNLYTNLLSLGLRPQFESNLQQGRGGFLNQIIPAATTVAKAFV